MSTRAGISVVGAGAVGLGLLALSLVMGAAIARPLCHFPRVSVPTRAGRQNPKQSGLAQKRAQSITGRLATDSGNPLPNVEITIQQVAGTEHRRATTDEDGKFIARDLGPGAYTLRPYATGYVDQSDEAANNFYRPGDFAAIRLVKGGVITGTVTDAIGVHAAVRATRVADPEGHSIRQTRADYGERTTDDRGIYRIFGLRPGSYIVCVAGFGNVFQGIVYTDTAPTYFPSTTRAGAAQILVRAGLVTQGVDIRYLAEVGHIISGNVPAAPGATSASSVTLSLIDLTSGSVSATAYVWNYPRSGSFAFHGVPDGEYYVVAQGYTTVDPRLVSPLYRIKVKGADISGLIVVLGPLSTLSGRVLTEPLKAGGKDACPRPPESFLAETVFIGQAGWQVGPRPINALPRRYNEFERSRKYR